MPPPPIPLLFGPMLIGVFLNTILYGILVMQAFIYLQIYHKDPPWIRFFILFLFVAETVNTVLNINMIYQPLILEYGTQRAVTFFPTLLVADPILTVIISTPVQIFIAWRIHIISKAAWLSGLICFLALTAFGGGIWLSVAVKHVEQFSRKPELHWPALVWLLSSAVVDVLITGSLVFHLSRCRTGFTGTDNMINRIIRLTIQTGMITAVFAILDVICFLIFPHTTINFVWDFALCKLYTNALLSTLNARAGWSVVANGRKDNILLFGGSDGLYSKGTEMTITSVNFQFQNHHQQGVSRINAGDGLDHTRSAAYINNEIDSASPVLDGEKASASVDALSAPSLPDLEWGVSVKREVVTRLDPVA